MGNTSTPIGVLGGSVSEINGMAKGKLEFVPFNVTMSNAYATSGDTFAQAVASTLGGSGIGRVRGQELRQVIIAGSSDKTRNYFWDGSLTAPKIMAESRAGVEVGAAVDLSASIVFGILVYEA